MAAAIERAVPFVRFRVERALARGETGSPEGRDRILEELRPVFATLPPSAMRMELTRLVSSRLELPESLAGQLLAEPARRHGGAQTGAGAERPAPGATRPGVATPASAGAISRREDTERAFLALCIALPQEGTVALAALDVEEDFSAELMRRAARHLREGDLSTPMAQAPGEGEREGPDGDERLRKVLAELVVQAAGEEPNPAMLEVQRLQLELARLERGIQRARGQQGSDVTGLAREKAEVKVQFDRAYARVLEETGERGV
jgi:DNA primase